jgi:hypothetical protein
MIGDQGILHALPKTRIDHPSRTSRRWMSLTLRALNTNRPVSYCNNGHRLACRACRALAVKPHRAQMPNYHAAGNRHPEEVSSSGKNIDVEARRIEPAFGPLQRPTWLVLGSSRVRYARALCAQTGKAATAGSGQ